MVRTITPATRHARRRHVLVGEDPTNDQEDVMSRLSTTHRPTAGALERLAARRRAARGQQELRDVLDGHHGKGVRADVLAAMRRS